MSDKPNVLMICTDHWSGELLGCAGHPDIQTPTLDHLATHGVLFNRAYSGCPVCIPARRTLMTGTNNRTHGDRTFQAELPMPDVPTLAETFSNAGYQTFAAGKLHVYPQRDRIGFDDVQLQEEGRTQWGVIDDHEHDVAAAGYAGQTYIHGMGNNTYSTRPWHLPEHLHATNWATNQISRFIKRRDPTRPGFYYVSYCHPHPPLVPVQEYLDMYRDVVPKPAVVADWVENSPVPLELLSPAAQPRQMNEEMIHAALRAFYALCTHIDHQLRVVIGTLREEGLLDNTIILFTSDHGDMLGRHDLWAKRLFYEPSARVPMLLLDVAGSKRVASGVQDDRLVELQDVMPTLLDLAGVPVPDSVDGISMVGADKRERLYGEFGEGNRATRMMHGGRHKLIYYAAGNRFQLFDLEDDPLECHDLSESDDHKAIFTGLRDHLHAELYGSDLEWIKDGEWVGLPATNPDDLKPARNLFLQRGWH